MRPLRTIMIGPLALLTIGTAVAQPPAAPAPGAPPADKPSEALAQVSGRWVGGFQTQANGEVSNSLQFELKAQGGELVGSMMELSPTFGKAGYPIQGIKNGLISGAHVSFLVNFGRDDQTLSGEVDGDSLVLTRKNSRGVFLPRIVLERVSKEWQESMIHIPERTGEDSIVGHDGRVVGKAGFPRRE